ncbi:hypothetical protein [Natrinema longum]|uniref:Uncharacterized protein n=1 Tax=Natrinema longum TaxID=370324 RepID=A0A8A2UAQ5_9EURY|nr:hypothetical protein [Natrinema longum]MBZ6493377.1 hypothetical protein [Natrinema longum]QSW85275.1 hypothetical protein J0X27_00030 [Natrinema longum]
MTAVDPPRVAFVLSLVVLGISVAAFASVAGATSVLTSEPAGTFAIDDGSLTFAAGDGTETTIVDDVSDLERIEISHETGGFAVTTEPRDPPRLSEDRRELAKRTALTNATIADRLETTGGATVTVIPISAGTLPRERAELAEIDRDGGRVRNGAVDEPTFETRSAGPNRVIVRSQNTSAIREDRALVIVEPVGEPVEYRTVIDLESETVERLLRLEFVAG